MRVLTFEDIVFKFNPLTIDDEEQWRDWLRKEVVKEAWNTAQELPPESRMEYVSMRGAAVSRNQASFFTNEGCQAIDDPKALAFILGLSARHGFPPPAPQPDDPVFRRLVDARLEEAQDIVLEVVPTTAHRRAYFQKKLAEARAKEAATLQQSKTLLSGQTGGR